MGRPRKPSRFPVEQIAAEYQCGDTCKTLGDRYGCSSVMIYYLLKQHGITLRPNHASVSRLKAHCCRGHKFTPENTYTDRRGHRACIACKTEWSRAYRARKKNQ